MFLSGRRSHDSQFSIDSSLATLFILIRILKCHHSFLANHIRYGARFSWQPRGYQPDIPEEGNTNDSNRDNASFDHGFYNCLIHETAAFMVAILQKQKYCIPIPTDSTSSGVFIVLPCKTKSYPTLNTYLLFSYLFRRSGLTLIKRFFKGVAALKPQRPRYEFVWDPSPNRLLGYFVSARSPLA